MSKQKTKPKTKKTTKPKITTRAPPPGSVIIFQKRVTKPKKSTSSPLYGTEAVLKALATPKTAVQLAEALGITKTTAQVYLKKLIKARKLKSKLVRQGKRGPKAIAFEVK